MKRPVRPKRTTIMGAPAAGEDPPPRFAAGGPAVHKLPADLAPLEEMGALWSALVRQLGD